MRSLPLFIMLSACTLLAQEDAVFRIASFNVRSPEDPPPNNWRARIPRMLDVMEKYKMDSIGMQELVEEQKKALLGDGSVYAAVGVGRDPNSGSPKRRKSQAPCHGRPIAAASAHGPN